LFVWLYNNKMNRDLYRRKNLARDTMYDVAKDASMFDLLDSMRRYRKPGQYYQALDPAKRAILENLKSEDVADVRWPWYDNTNSSNRKE